MAAAADVPDGFSDLLDFGHIKRKLRWENICREQVFALS